jgi:flagellar hook-basal body complex protein FliE
MAIGSIKALGSIDPRSAYGVGSVNPAPKPSFASQLQNAIRDVEGLQVKREQAVEDMVTGRTTEVHDVMIAAKESQLAFELLLEVRNKLLESYQEIMRMPV